MRKELEGLQGNEYFAAWDRLMRDIGGEVIAYFKDLLLWAEDEQAEVGLYGATCDQFDLPVKTLVVWLGKQGIINRQLYDLVVSDYRVEQIRARGVHLLQCRAEGLSYPEVLEAERLARQRQNAEREKEWRDKNFPAIESAFDQNGALLRVGDKAAIKRRNGETETVVVKELRVRAGKLILKNDARLFYESGGRLENYPAILAVRVDSWYGE